jgi:hypothetical protein
MIYGITSNGYQKLLRRKWTSAHALNQLKMEMNNPRSRVTLTESIIPKATVVALNAPAAHSRGRRCWPFPLIPNSRNLCLGGTILLDFIH